MTMVPKLDLHKIRQALNWERDQLLHRPTDTESPSHGIENLDENDLADLYESREIQSSLDAFSVRKLDRILRAIDRLNKGTYGVCPVCKEVIPAERLMALPYAELCVACQKMLEGKEKRA